MRRTPLNRGTKQLKRTPLKRGNTPLKRTLIKFKPKRFPIPKEELAKVDERANGKCEYCGDICENVKHDYAHIRHRGIGGVQGTKSRIINDHRNIVWICRIIHDVIDGRGSKIYAISYVKGIRDALKRKIGWYEWYEENKEVINR